MRISCLVPFTGEEPYANRLLCGLQITMFSFGSRGAIGSFCSQHSCIAGWSLGTTWSAGRWGNFVWQKCRMMKMSVGQHLQFQKNETINPTETIVWRRSSTQAMLGKWMYRFIGGLVCWPSIQMSSLHGLSIL